ncbi:MAG: hypothetical protein WDA20_04645 [Desulfuromonadales bacterium]
MGRKRQVDTLGIQILPSDLVYKYPRKKETRHLPKFTGKPDPRPFDCDDLYDVIPLDVIPLLEAVMDTLGTDDGRRVLNRLEEILSRDIPRWLDTRSCSTVWSKRREGFWTSRACRQQPASILQSRVNARQFRHPATHEMAA